MILSKALTDSLPGEKQPSKQMASWQSADKGKK